MSDDLEQRCEEWLSTQPNREQMTELGMLLMKHIDDLTEEERARIKELEKELGYETPAGG